MKHIIALLFSMCCGLTVSAQAAGESSSTVRDVVSSPDAERVRISAERGRVEAAFNIESAACYKKILVNICLDEVKSRRRDALADLRRQDLALNALERRAKGAEQFRKTEEKSSPEMQQQDAEKRAAALRDVQSRMGREKQKTADRADAQADEVRNSQALAARLKANEEKANARSSKQAGAAEELKKFNERQDNARERRAQHERDQLSQTKPVKSLPVPQ